MKTISNRELKTFLENNKDKKGYVISTAILSPNNIADYNLKIENYFIQAFYKKSYYSPEEIQYTTHEFLVAEDPYFDTFKLCSPKDEYRKIKLSESNKSICIIDKEKQINFGTIYVTYSLYEARKIVRNIYQNFRKENKAINDTEKQYKLDTMVYNAYKILLQDLKNKICHEKKKTTDYPI